MEVLLKDENLSQKDDSKDLILYTFLSENAPDSQRLFISQFLASIVIQQDTSNKSFYSFLVHFYFINKYHPILSITHTG